MAGVLYIVATPIGNLDDLTLRAAKILQEVAGVACEDTRQTAKLMEAAGARQPLISLHEHNEADRAPELVRRLQQGESFALVSDAGTPLISDPGFRLVRLAIESGVRVCPLPGPSAVLAALSASGLETDSFFFGGFLPHKSKARQDTLRQYGSLATTLIFFESPHRILECLSDLETVLPGRRVVLARELTKIHEEFLRGSAPEIYSALAGRAAIKGEFTLLIGKPDAENRRLSSAEMVQAVNDLVSTGMDRMEAIKKIARESGLSKREVYEVVVNKS
jgi:16S rRNA (cytidine1402-2'-O)-methyltransferase